MIKLSNLLSEHDIVIGSSSSKWDALLELVNCITQKPQLASLKDEIMRSMAEREEIMSTGIGRGIAVPHVRIAGLDKIYITFGVFRNPIEYASIDDKPVRIVVLMVVPQDMHREYLRVLSKVVLVLKNPELCNGLLNAESHHEIYTILSAF